MAVLVIGELPGGDAAMDQRIMQELGLQNTAAPGAIARFAGPTDTGYRIITVWESEDAFQTFRRERLAPTLERLGMGAPNAQVFPLDSYRIAPAAAQQA